MSISDKLINTWLLVSFEMRKEKGDIVYPFGKDVKGMLIYTSSGNFSAQVMQNDRPLFKSGDQMKGSSEEIEASFKGVISYFGHYTFDEKENSVLHHIEGSLFPNWKGLTMKRFTEFKDDILELSTEPLTWGGENSIGMIVWRRSPDL